MYGLLYILTYHDQTDWFRVTEGCLYHHYWHGIVTLMSFTAEYRVEQVDSLISKNQALQILYLKHHVYKAL